MKMDTREAFSRFRRGARAGAAGIVLLLPPCVFALAETQEVSTAKVPELRPPLNFMPPSFWEAHGWTVAVAALAALAASALAVWLLRRPKPVVVTPADVAARQALEALRERTEDESVVAEASRNLRHYLVAVFGSPPEELTTEELRATLEHRPQVPAELTAALVGLLRECDARQFAPIPPPAKPALVPRALDLVSRCESLRQPPAAPAPVPPPPAA